MGNVMNQLKEKLKQYSFVQKLLPYERKCKNAAIDLRTVPYFIGMSRQKRKEDAVIKVGFLCQYIPAWNKFEPIYRTMRKNSRFEPMLICVPQQIENKQLLDPRNTENDTYSYFVQHGYDALNALTGPGEWLDLQALGLDYVFYTRPYNSYMPEPYTSAKVKQYAKICSVIYGMNLTKEMFDVTLNTDFYKDIYVYFAETGYAKRFFESKFPVTTRLNIRHCRFYGMPAFQQILADRDKPGTSWKFSKNNFRVLWTPRWTTDPKLGGSNFFAYYQSILEFAERHQEMSFLLRPHPLAFPNFIKTGEMTEEEVAAYKQKIEQMANVCLDNEREYDTTMWESSVMISDISAIMAEYFITGKPIIYCASNMKLTLAEHTEEMMRGCYVANTPEQAFAYLEMLQKGEDPLRQTRQEIIGATFGEDLSRVSDHIVDALRELS